MAGAPSTTMRALLAVSVPVAVGQFALVAMSLIDSAMVGRLGPAPLAAVSLGNVVTFTPTVFALGLLMAGAPLVAQNHGAGRDARCGAVLAQCLRLAVGLGVLLAVVLVASRPVIGLLTPDPVVASEAYRYVLWRTPGIVAYLLAMAYRIFLDGLGITRPGMVVTLAADVVNAACDALLVFGYLGVPAMGIAGAGLGGSIARIFLLVCLAALAHQPEHRRHGVGLAGWRAADAGLTRTLVRMGAPTAIQLGAEVAAFGGFAVMMGFVSTETQAAHHIAITLASSSFMIAMGFSAGATVLVGRSVGRGDLAGAARSGMQALWLNSACMGASALLFMVAPAALAHLFTPNTAVVAQAVVLIRFAAAFQLVDGAQAVLAGALRGAGDTFAPMVISLVMHWVAGIPLAWLFGVEWGRGGPGVWGAMTAMLTVLAGVLWLRWRGGRWRHIGFLDASPR
jgi:MATE family multidrug resistance protein